MSWLKFDTDTPEKPEVLAITGAMGWDDPDLTVGKLLRVWRWFDKHTVDGNARGVTSALLDRAVGVTGLAQAMADVGWLIVENDGIRLPNFERHNGQTAKDRALTAKRVAKAKGNGKGNALTVTSSVSDALPREEKRREEEITSKSKSKEQVRSRGSRLPSDWEPSDELLAWAKAERPDVDARREVGNFRDYWAAKAGQAGTKLDWDATFRNWIRNARPRAGPVNGGGAIMGTMVVGKQAQALMALEAMKSGNAMAAGSGFGGAATSRLLGFGSNPGGGTFALDADRVD